MAPRTPTSTWVETLFNPPSTPATPTPPCPSGAKRKRPGGPRKLTWDDVVWMRERAPYVSQRWLAEFFEVSPSLVSKILARKTWQNPPPADAPSDLGTWRKVS